MLAFEERQPRKCQASAVSELRVAERACWVERRASTKALWQKEEEWCFREGFDYHMTGEVPELN